MPASSGFRFLFLRTVFPFCKGAFAAAKKCTFLQRELSSRPKSKNGRPAAGRPSISLQSYSRSSPLTIWALIKLVEPLLPRGTPAVITTVSPS